MVQQVSLTFAVRKRWLFHPAMLICAIGLRLGLIHPKASDAHVGGFESAGERAARWLVDHTLKLSVR